MRNGNFKPRFQKISMPGRGYIIYEGIYIYISYGLVLHGAPPGPQLVGKPGSSTIWVVVALIGKPFYFGARDIIISFFSCDMGSSGWESIPFFFVVVRGLIGGMRYASFRRSNSYWEILPGS